MIRITDLNKSIGRLSILSGMNIHFRKGRVTFIIGPNGSGKSTLIKIILGLMKPDTGEIMVGDAILNGDSEYRQKIGYMPQRIQFPENLTVREIFELIKKLRNSDGEPEKNLISDFSLDKEVSKRLSYLSGGTRQKVNAVISMMFNPEILILDEPATGLDPVNSRIFKNKILAAKNEGKTVIITSHLFNDIEELADDLVALIEGKVAYQGSYEGIFTVSGSGDLETALATLMTGVPV